MYLIVFCSDASQSDRSNHGNDNNWKTMTNVVGRIMFGVWRLLKHEVSCYTLWIVHHFFDLSLSLSLSSRMI